jgi:glucose-6-phosphate isomerase
MTLARLDVETSAAMDAALDLLVRDDALGQLLERRGRMAALATENGDVKLDWADQVAWALDHPEAIGELETLAAWIRSRFDHVIWSGMGGSVQALHTLNGLLPPHVQGRGARKAGLSIHPLDSTDPAALNRLLREIAPTGDLGARLQRTLMVGVSMGMTSEEPITHLRWFEELLRAHAVESPAEHLLVMTLPGSFLDLFAEERSVRRESVQLDGQSHTPGRMSAPSTRVFLLPASLCLAGGVRDVLEQCQAEFQLRQGMTAGERAALIKADPFARLAAWLSANIDDGRDMVVLDLPERWAPVAPWVEQVVEESLGKDGRGLLIFHGQDLKSASLWPDRFTVLRVDEGSGMDVDGRPHAQLQLATQAETLSSLVVSARFFSGWNLAVALVGYLQGMTFAGQPAVEGYKKYARLLRDSPGELPYPTDGLSSTPTGRLKLFSGAAPAASLDSERPDAGTVLAAVVRSLQAERRLDYFDVTVNGEPAGPLWEAAQRAGMRFGNHVLQRPTKVRSGPRDYHSTEQSETAGPPGLLSLRVLVSEPEPVAAGDYNGRFLHAQALGTLFAMRDAGRPVLLATVSREDGGEAVAELLENATARLDAAPASHG